MPRKTEDTKKEKKKVEIENEKKVVSKAKKVSDKTKATVIKKDSKVIKSSTAKKNVSKKEILEKEVVDKKTTKKVTVKKKATKKTTTKKASAKKVATKKTTKKVTAKKEVVKNETKKKTVKKSYLVEFYELPYRYNETIVKILAQTPKKLFVYWDISDDDIKKYKKVFGENFFYDTYPVLLIHNEELNYTFEVAVNDFANSWYVDVNDAKCKYTVNLGRKFKNISELNVDNNIIKQENIDLKNDYLQISSSNKLEIPNDRILFDRLGKNIKFKNIKNNIETIKKIENVVLNKEGNLEIYNIYNLYQEIYKNEIEENIFDLNNPSSGNTSSKIQFK